MLEKYNYVEDNRENVTGKRAKESYRKLYSIQRYVIGYKIICTRQVQKVFITSTNTISQYHNILIIK